MRGSSRALPRVRKMKRQRVANVSEDPARVQGMRQLCVWDKPLGVRRMLVRHPASGIVLVRAAEIVPIHSGPEVRLAWRAIWERDRDGAERLLALTHAPQPPGPAPDRLECSDDDWWFDAMPGSNDVLSFALRFASHGLLGGNSGNLPRSKPDGRKIPRPSGRR